MADVVAPEAPKLEAKHFAAGMVDRASVDREVLAMQNLKTLKDGETVFQHEIAVPDENVKEPNFKELNDIALEVDATVNPRTRESRQSLVLKKIEDLQNIITKETPITVRQLQYVGEIASDIPAIIKSVAKDTGLTEARVKVDLRAGGAGNPSIVQILNELCDSKPFLEILSANIGNIEVSKEMIEKKGQIKSLKEKTDREKLDIDNTRKIYDDPTPGSTAAKQWFDGLSAADKIAIPNVASDYTTMIQTLNDVSLGQFQRSSLSGGEVGGYQASLQRKLTSLFVGAPGANFATITAPGGIDALALTKYPVNMVRGGYDGNAELRDKLVNGATSFLAAFEASDRIRTIYVARPRFDTELGKLQLYLEKDAKLNELKGREDSLTAEKATLTTMETMQGKDVASIAGKLEKVMERSFKDYYNKSMLTRGKQIAEYDANQKTELKQKEADLKAKQVEITKVLLDKYLRMSFLKYKNGNVDGYDDKGLKKLVKEDLFSHSPADMARELLRRVYDNRGDFPDTYKKEIDVLCKEMGLGAGPPRLTFNDVLKKMDTSVLAGYAATEMPKAFGYARARGYYFDRLRLKKHQVQYIADTDGYGTEFFTTMLAEAERSAQLMTDEKIKNDVLRSIDVAGKQLRDATFGKDYQQGIINALKVATAATAATAGFYYLGGLPSVGAVARAGASMFNLSGRAAVGAVQGGSNFVTQTADAVLKGYPEGIRIVVP